MAGICPLRLDPTVSIMYLPTFPEEFAMPSGCRALFELRRIRTDSPLLAASTGVYPFFFAGRLIDEKYAVGFAILVGGHFSHMGIGDDVEIAGSERGR